MGSLCTIHHHRQTVAAAKKKHEALVKAVSSSTSYATDPTKLKTDSTALIKDSSTSDADQAKAYIARGDSEYGLKQYAAAAADYEKGVQLDSSQQVNVSYREFNARYQAGERKTLIPLLQTMVQEAQAQKSDFSVLTSRPTSNISRTCRTAGFAHYEAAEVVRARAWQLRRDGFRVRPTYYESVCHRSD
ncbi:MAG: hypothetical protein WDN27_04225 [Candidatus Saccharibacteria bacterium]